MKNTIPVPAVIGAIVVVLLVAGFFIMRSGTTQEFPAPKTEKVIPQYVWDTMTPEMQGKMKSEGYTVGDVKGNGQPSAVPGKQ